MSAAPAAPPGPSAAWWGLPLLRAMARDYLGFAQNLQRRYGDVVAMRTGPERSWDLFHPDDVRSALVDHADHLVRWERGIAVFAQVFGQGLLVAEGEAWRRQRRMLAPGFMPRRMQGLATLMADAATMALDKALPAGQAEAMLPMDTLFNRLTMDVIMRTLFGRPVDGDMADSADAAIWATQELSQRALREMFLPMTLPDWLPLPGKAAKRRALRTLRRLIDHAIAERQALPPHGRPDDDLLAMLLAARDTGDDGDGSALAATEVHDQCMVMFQAGHETTATALLWWSWLMASHPAAARRAHDEVDAVLKGRQPTAGDIAALPWITATLKEALRLYPPIAALMTRRVRRPFGLGGRTVPTGTLLRVTPWVIQRDPRWFAEPDAFHPERFLPGAPEVLRGTWLPFGTGPRVCIGQHFALLEATTVAALLLQRYTLHTVAGEAPPRPVMHVTLRPATPLRLRVVRRRPAA